MKIGFSENFCNLKIFFKHFPINPIANWTYGQNIENRATPPLSFLYREQKCALLRENFVGITSLVPVDFTRKPNAK